MKTKNLVIIALSIILASCSTSQQTTENKNDKEPEVYVFDDVNRIDTVSVEHDSAKSINVFPIPPEEKIPPVKEDQELQIVSSKYIVQVGAFSTRERAERFVNDNRHKINYDMNISINDKTNLFVVQLPPFNSHEQAELLRNNIWKIPVFKDAFIITKEE